MASLGGAASGAGLGATLGSIVPGIGTGIGAGIGGLIGLFTGGKKKTPNPATDVNGLSSLALTRANEMNAQGKDLSTQGSDALHPYIASLLRIFGGDRNAAFESAAPEINTITDQYDSALRAANTGIARGGGRNATMANLPYAKDAAIQTALQQERAGAGKELGTIGTNLSQLGVAAQGASQQTLAQLIDGARQGHADSMRALEDLGLGLGQIAAMIYAAKTGKKGKD